MSFRPRPALIFSALLLIGSSLTAHAQGTHLWTEDSFSDFEKGTPDGIAIGSDGTLTAGPALHQLAQLNAGNVWAVAADSRGNAFAATGSPAQVVRVTPDGKQTILFTTKDLSVQALTVGPDGNLYAATLPSGKVFRIDPSAAKPLDETTAPLVFDPAAVETHPKYVWALAFDKQDRLYVAAGAPGGIYRIALHRGEAGAKPELFFRSDEPHIRSLLFLPNGDLLAGSDGSGLIYRVGADGKGFVVFEAGKREITSMALGPQGQVYLAGVGEKGKDTSLPPLAVTSTGATPAGVPVGSVTITVVQPGSTQAVTNNTNVPDGSEVYLLPASPADAPRRIWADHEEVVYALHATAKGVLGATGNHGRIFLLHDDGTYADIAHTQAAQAIDLATLSDGSTLVGTANSGKLFALGRETKATPATLTSDVFDASGASLWGRAELIANGAGYTLETRVGNLENPLRGWSDWKPYAATDATLSQQPARYAQWRLTLPPGGPAVHSVALNYLPANAAPVVDEVTVAPGARVNAASVAQPQPAQISIYFPSQGAVNADPNSAQTPLSAMKDKTGTTVRWAAHDDNGDDLTFDLYYQAIGDPSWRLLKSGLTDRYYTFDTNQLPDGPYRMRVVASDAPSHPTGMALTDDRVSDLFQIDTETPSVASLTAQLTGNSIHVVATATDSKTPIAHAAYSLDAGPWQYVEPVGRLSDASQEHYDFQAPLPKDAQPAPHTLTLRVFDRFDNEGSGKATVK